MCLVHVDNLCDIVLSAWGEQKLDQICESFCSSSQVLEPFLDDNDLTEDIRAFLCIALEDLATRQGLRMLQKVPRIFTTNAPVFRQLMLPVMDPRRQVCFQDYLMPWSLIALFEECLHTHVMRPKLMLSCVQLANDQ